MNVDMSQNSSPNNRSYEMALKSMNPFPPKMQTRKNRKGFGNELTNVIGNQHSDDEGSYVNLYPK